MVNLSQDARLINILKKIKLTLRMLAGSHGEQSDDGAKKH